MKTINFKWDKVKIKNKEGSQEKEYYGGKEKGSTEGRKKV